MPAAGNQIDRNDYDIARSQQAQANFQAVAARLEALITQRDADVKTAMADYSADGVSDDYAAKEVRWNAVATSVRDIIHTLRTSMTSNDETAAHALQRARAAVGAIA